MKTLAERLADLQAAQERERRADMEVHRALSAAGVTGLDVEEGHIEAALKYGGAVIGLGDWHSRYGLFTVELFK